MDSSINNGMCRCCAAENTFKDLHTTYQWMGDEEIYSTMLRDCFNVDLITSEEGNGGICEVCITQLRNAANFKKQVLHTEEQFRRHLQDKPFKTTIVNIVKQEYEKQDVSDDDSDRNMSDDFSPDFEIPIKQEPVEVEPKTKSKKRAASVKATATVTKAKKAKIEVGESSTRRIGGQISKTNDVVKPNIRSLQRLLTNVTVTLKKHTLPTTETQKFNPREVNWNSPVKLEMSNSVNTNITAIPNKQFLPKSPVSKGSSSRNKMFLHKLNLTHLLMYSNASPFKSYTVHAGYSCVFCPQHLHNPAELKVHTLSEHRNNQCITFFMSKFSAAYYLVKLDITGLKCELCDSLFERLESLMRHLQDDHEKKMHLDLANSIIPFDFSQDLYTCVYCATKFENYKLLVEHMNVHFKNFVCHQCAKAFAQKTSLESHQKRHRVGEFPCSLCSKVFNTRENLGVHVRTVHLNRKYVKCLYCDMTFRSNQQKLSHMANEHGVERETIQCKYCVKTFRRIGVMYNHVRRDHKLERNYVCDNCGMSFFQKTVLISHIQGKHLNMKEFKCEVCHKEYQRKYTLIEHMRIHNNDRRFKCEHCGKDFVQKCSWKGHMKSKHGEIV